MIKIKHIEGNLLDFPEGIDILIHQANIEASMYSGIAGAITKRYPAAAEKDKQYFDRGLAVLGGFSAYQFETDFKFIVNLYGQSIAKLSSAGIPTDYNAVIMAFNEITNWLDSGFEEDVPIIGVPYAMGCGLGGGNWGIYEAIIQNTIGMKYQVICVRLV